MAPNSAYMDPSRAKRLKELEDLKTEFSTFVYLIAEDRERIVDEFRLSKRIRENSPTSLLGSMASEQVSSTDYSFIDTPPSTEYNEAKAEEASIMSLGSQRQPQVEFHGAYLNAPYYDYGFDVVRPIDTQSPEDFDRYLNFLKAVLKKWRGTIDPKGKFFIVHQHYFEWKFKERQIIPFDGNYFLQFGSKSCQREPTHNVEETYLEIWRLAEEYLGSDIVRRSKCWFSGDQKRDLPDWKPPTDRALREAREAVLGMAEVLDPPAWKLALQVEGVTIDEQPSQVNVFRQDTLMEDVDHSAQDLTLPSINELLAGIGDDSGAPTRTRESAPPPPDREASPRPWRGVLPLLNSLSRNSSRSSIDAENVQSLLSGNFLTAPTSPINPALTRILDSIEVPPNVPHPMRASLDNMFSKLEVNICLEGTLKETECTMSQAIVAELRKRKGLHLGFYDILANEEMRVYLECHENVKEFPALFVEGKLLDLKAAELLVILQQDPSFLTEYALSK